MIRRILHSSDESDPEDNHDRRRRKVYNIRRNFDIDDNFSFKEAFRLSKQQVRLVLNIIGPIIGNTNNRNYALTAKEQLLLCLHWLGNGAQFHSVASIHGVNKATVCRKIHHVVDVIVDSMLHTTVCWPANVHDLARKFYQKGGFPSVCGCVDGTLIPIDAPNEHEENYVDRHGNHSLNVMMVCGPDYNFYAVNAGWPGSVHDARVLRNAAVFRRFENGWRPFPGAVILGDSAYPLKNWLIPPLRRNPDNENERRFNRYHKKTRRLIEDTLGILKEKFPCLNHMRLQPVRAAKIVLACCILHNIARTIDREPAAGNLGNADNENADEVIDEPRQQQEEEDVDQAAEERIAQLLRFFN